MTEPPKSSDNLDRRDLLKELAAAGLVAGLGGIVHVEPGEAAEATRHDVLEGYAGQLSYEPRDRVNPFPHPRRWHANEFRDRRMTKFKCRRKTKNRNSKHE